MVHVVQRGILDDLVLEDPLPLVVFQGEDLLTIEPHAPIILSQEHLVVARARHNAIGRRLDI